MKKQILLFMALLLTGTMFAQDQKLYISLSPGIGLATNRTYDLAYQPLNELGGVQWYDSYPVGLGKGLNINLHAGYFLSEMIAIDLGITYRMGFNTKLNIKLGANATDNPDVATYDAGTIKYKCSMLQLVPGIVISPVPQESKIRPYGRLGVIIGIIPSIKEAMDVKSYAGNDHIASDFKYSGGVTLGGQAALGCDYNLSERLAIFAELYFNMIGYSPKKGKYSKYEENGVDMVPTWDKYLVEYEYVKDLTNYTPSMNEPSQQLKNNYTNNNAGINIGVKIKL